MHIEIIEKEIGSVTEIEEYLPMMQMSSAMARDYARIARYYYEQGIEDMGAPYARYVDINWMEEMNKGFLAGIIGMFTKKWHFFAGIPSKRAVDTSGELKAGYIPNKIYLQTLHQGPYHKLIDTYKTLYNHAKEKNLKLASECIEIYLNDPGVVKKAELETLVMIPLL
jgi:effector-binding domain-containing protein